MSILLGLELDASISATVSAAARLLEVTVELGAAGDVQRRLKAQPEEIALVLVGPDVDEPVRTAQRVFVLAPHLPVLILSAGERLEALRRAVQISPYVTEGLRCLPADDLPLMELAVKEALERHRGARAYDRTVAALNARLGEAPRAMQPAMLGGILDNAPIGVVLIDAEGTIRAWNRACAALLGRVEREALGASFDEVLGPSGAPGLKALLASPPDEGRESTSGVFERRLDGGVQHLEIVAAPLRSAQGTHLLLLQDVSERVRLVSKLRTAVRAREEFLSIAAHELRTPLTSLQLLVRGLGRSLDKPDLLRLPSRVQSLERSVAQLTRLVEALLDHTRITEGRLELQREETDLVPIAREVVDRLCADAERAGCTITLQLDASVPGRWDPFRLDQVLTNLLSNAIKYGRGKPVEVRSSGTSDAVQISVRDHGMGMDDALQARLFRQFERGVSSRHFGGLGLGLWITRSIVEAHGGRISVVSRLGDGSEFVVALPRG